MIDRAVGVDFGTSTSLVADREDAARAEVVPLGMQQGRYVPSVAALRDGRLVFGERAEGRPDGVIRSIKRGITQNLSTVTVPTAQGPVQVAVDDVVLGLLGEIMSRARGKHLPLEKEPVVRLGCPALWTGEQRRRLLNLARQAGLPVDHSTLVDEPVAAGVAWLSHSYLARRESPQGRVLVFDMGGGTLDIAVLDVVGGPRPDVRVLASLGVPEAGDDLDRTLAAELEAELAGRGFVIADLPDAAELRFELLHQARLAKVRLSLATTSTIPLDAGRFGGETTVTLTRARLEELFEPQLSRAEQLLWAALRAARLTEDLDPAGRGPVSVTPESLRRLGPADLAADVRYVVLAGGMSQIPVVARRLAELLPKAEVHERVGDFQPDELVVAGLADTAGYDRINLHRPAFDFVLDVDGVQRVLYEAYTPLYNPAQLALGATFLGHEWRGNYPLLPRHGTGVLRVVSPGGDPVRLAVDEEEMDGLSVAFGSRGLTFKIYCGGQVLVEDGKGRRHQLRVAHWPVVRGAGQGMRLELTRLQGASDPVVAWYYNDVERHNWRDDVVTRDTGTDEPYYLAEFDLDDH
jgi:molecular chaperone DnaK (HSP70)